MDPSISFHIQTNQEMTLFMLKWCTLDICLKEKGCFNNNIHDNTAFVLRRLFT